MTSLDAPAMQLMQASLNSAQSEFVSRFPGESNARQPIHVVYGGAHLFKAETAQKLGALARQSLNDFAPHASALGSALGLSDALAERVYPRVVEKLQREAVEDFRIDFEDGYGHRSDEEEDGHAVEAAQQVARGFREKLLPECIGIRIKPLSAELGLRAIRTLDLFLTTLMKEGFEGRLPLITLPKVIFAAQISILVNALSSLEKKLGLAHGSLRIECMVEAAQGLIDAQGRAVLPQIHTAADGRLYGAHFGAYDYTASLDITAAEQRMRHPACDAARTQMKLAFAGTGVFVSDGATTHLPIAPHRGPALTLEQKHENERAIHAAWRASAEDIRHSLANGFYQGWDLHPAQLVARYGTVFGFFLESLAPVTVRLANFVSRLGQATLSGHTFDDAATGQGLLNFFLRGLSCGALTQAEAEATGLTSEELKSWSFAFIASNRRQ